MSITVRTGSNASEISGADAFKSQRVVGNLDSDTNVPTFASNHGISLESSVSSKRVSIRITESQNQVTDREVIKNVTVEGCRLVQFFSSCFVSVFSL